MSYVIGSLTALGFQEWESGGHHLVLRREGPIGYVLITDSEGAFPTNGSKRFLVGSYDDEGTSLACDLVERADLIQRVRALNDERTHAFIRVTS